MPNFWKQLNNPFFCLAPMEDVTDVAFREMFARYSGGHSVLNPKPYILNPFVMFTEFVNVDGLTHPEGYKKLSLALKYTEAQRPMVAQIWGTNPDKFYEAAKIVVGLGFDGIDINMGCPQDKEIGLGSCAALIRNPKLAGEIISATKKGAGELPVSVKTRLGYTKADEMAGWVTFLLQQNIAALSLHARTKQEKSKVPAQWEKIAEAVKIRNSMKVETLIIGNGDVKSRAEGLKRAEETGCDGVMIARGAFGNPWLFKTDNYQPNIKERLSVMLEHARLFNSEFGGNKPFVIMRKHFKAYVSGFDGAAELRAKLMETKSLEETEEVVKSYLI
jgi:nifR3 family TIM-barrel protein